MQTHQLERMLRLANKTGGKLIITDSAGNRPVVILGLDEYESLLEAPGSAKAMRSLPVAVAATTVPVQKIVDEPTVNEAVNEDDDDEADVTAMEEAMLAVEESMPEMVREEPKVVPVKERPAAVQPVESPSEVGEEQFYLEPL